MVLLKAVFLGTEHRPLEQDYTHPVTPRVLFELEEGSPQNPTIRFGAAVSYMKQDDIENSNTWFTALRFLAEGGLNFSRIFDKQGQRPCVVISAIPKITWDYNIVNGSLEGDPNAFQNTSLISVGFEEAVGIKIDDHLVAEFYVHAGAPIFFSEDEFFVNHLGVGAQVGWFFN